MIGDQALTAGHRMIDHVALTRACETAGFAHDEWFGGLVELRDGGLLQMQDYGGKVALLQLPAAGTWAYVTRSRTDLADVTERLLDLLDPVRSGSGEANIVVSLGHDLGESPLLVEAVLDHLAARRLVVYSRSAPTASASIGSV